MKATHGRQRIYDKSVAHLRADRILPVDAKGRISIGKTEGVTGYRVVQQKGEKIVLEAMASVPAREAWLYKNKRALADVLAGIADVKAGRVGPLTGELRAAFEKEVRELHS